jgi:hypothetical protein
LADRKDFFNHESQHSRATGDRTRTATERARGPSGFYGRLTGKTYESLEAMRHHERMEAMRRNVPTDEEAAFEALPAEKIKGLFERAAKSEPEKVDLMMSGIDLQTFFSLHPDYIDCQENTTPMVSFVRARGIKAFSKPVRMPSDFAIVR